jgi:Protein of unknown function (DUF2384)
MARKFSELLDQMPPESQARVASRVEEIKRVTALAQAALDTPNPVLDGRTPLDMLSMDGGARLGYPGRVMFGGRE